MFSSAQNLLRNKKNKNPEKSVFLISKNRIYNFFREIQDWVFWLTDTWWTSMKVYALAIISLFVVLASVHKWYQKTLKWFYSIGLKGCWDIFFSSFPIENNDSFPNYLNLFSVLSFNIHKSKGLNLKKKMLFKFHEVTSSHKVFPSFKKCDKSLSLFVSNIQLKEKMLRIVIWHIFGEDSVLNWH